MNQLQRMKQYGSDYNNMMNNRSISSTPLSTTCQQDAQIPTNNISSTQIVPPMPPTSASQQQEISSANSLSESPYQTDNTLLSPTEKCGTTSTTTFDYLYEFSETRKVLEDFFKCPNEEKKISEFNESETGSIVSIFTFTCILIFNCMCLWNYFMCILCRII